jgi:seryl-tRNA(Sec) selenium transferase
MLLLVHWYFLQAAAQASLEAWRSEEARRLARERRVLEQQSKALLSLPSKKEKAERDGLQAQMEKDRADAKAAAARHRLTVERLRCQIKELQVRQTTGNCVGCLCTATHMDVKAMLQQLLLRTADVLRSLAEG